MHTLLRCPQIVPGCLRAFGSTRMTLVPARATEGRTGSHMMPHDAELMQEAKEAHLKGEEVPVIPTAEGWSHDLASVSEATIKAERMPDMTMEQLQEHTVHVVAKREVKKEAAVSSGGAPKFTPDRTAMPSIQQNLEHSKSAPEARGHGSQQP